MSGGCNGDNCSLEYSEFGAKDAALVYPSGSPTDTSSWSLERIGDGRQI
jgi:hypothetical protein